MIALRRTLLALLAVLLVLTTALSAAAPAEAASKFKVYFTGKSAYQGINGYSGNQIVRASGAGGDVLSIKFWYRVWGKNQQPKAKVTVQRQVGKKWATVGKATRTRDYEFSFALPAYSVADSVASGTVSYRFKSAKSGKVKNTSYSKSYRVVYENRAAYTGLARTIADTIAPYCPTTAVHVVDTLADGRVGEFDSAVGISVLAKAVDGYSPENQTAVALHECAHQRQFTNFGSSPQGDEDAEKASANYFINDSSPDGKTPPVVGDFDAYEHAADCAALALNPKGYLGYGGYCNADELAHGAALMSGSKY